MRSIILNYDRQVTRILEILPPTISLLLLSFPFWGTFFVPTIVAYFVILFDVYFVYKAATLGINAVRSYRQIQKVSKFDWLGRLNTDHKTELSKTHHIVFIPTYKEPGDILQRTLSFIKEAEIPKQSIDIVLAFEEREQEAKSKEAELRKEFESTFANIWTTYHPLEEGEIAGKSSNLAHSAKEIKKIIEQKNYEKDHILVTVCDADVCLHPKYFALLTYKFLNNPNRYLRFFQGALVFYNNIWRIPLPARVVNTIYSILQVADLQRPKSSFNYSTYSLSWRLLEGSGFWDIDVISEDWHLFFKTFFANQGLVDLECLFLPLYADAAEGKSYFETLKMQYVQNRRWAWGITDISYVIKRFILHKGKLNLVNFLFRFSRALEQHLLWPVNWFVLTLGATVPPLISKSFRHTTLGYNLPKIAGLILTLSTVFLVFVIVVDFLLKPPRPKEFKKHLLPLNIIQYLLMPITSLFFNALPGMDAHTRLILGKRLDYKVTEKFVKKNP
ncbi:MAG: hypothetical protein A2Y57_02570 [Candidatus Woykebacteria bacterium RBG_13_40_7b]|uniref:Glycosyltransferase 2-like domain-containing protein n=1 Tax=Candidatus Woykebacteria bacterium RBG_13_40_7b TaxID=1802594 RepID=A0A1G1WBI0_9BACT|nr:MAG: hypothetical protein A2Y57_02570 [Candidatus Woykebacteria bacterium RBG_13_40_7b]